MLLQGRRILKIIIPDFYISTALTTSQDCSKIVDLIVIMDPSWRSRHREVKQPAWGRTAIKLRVELCPIATLFIVPHCSRETKKKGKSAITLNFLITTIVNQTLLPSGS